MTMEGLSKEELLYLSALRDASNLWGFEDSFQGKSEAEIKTILIELQTGLVRKNSLKVGVDGQISVESACADLIDACKESNQVFLISSSRLEEEKTVLRFFKQGSKVVRYQFRETGRFEFVSEDLMELEIKCFFDQPGDADDTSSLTTSIAHIRRMGSLSRQHFLQELRNSGCEDSLALLIADGLQGNADFKSLLVYDRSGAQDKLVDKLIILSFSGNSLIVSAEEGNVDLVCFRRIDQSQLNARLKHILGKEDRVSVI